MYFVSVCNSSGSFVSTLRKTKFYINIQVFPPFHAKLQVLLFCNMKEMTTNSFLHQCTQKLNLLTLRVPKNEDKEFLDEYAIRLEVKSNQERNISYQMVYNKLVPGQHMSINDAWSAFKTSLQNYACCPNRPLLNRIDCPA